MAITKQDIHAVADQIAADGGSPTLAAVRRVLGGGSFTTISEAMQEWKAARQNAAAPIREAGGISEFGKNRTLSEQVATRDAIVKHFVIYGIVLILD